VEGGFFEKDNVIVTIDDTTYQAALASAKAQLARAEALLQREQAESALAAREWERYGEGEPDALVLRKPQLAEAQAGVDSATAAVTKAQNDVDRTVIKAPYDGRIRAKLIEEGQFVGLGAPIARVYATDYAEVRLPISGDEIGYLDLPLGQSLEYEDENAPQVDLAVSFGRRTNHWQARIVRTEAEVDPRTRMYFAVARVKNPYTPEAGVPLLPNTFVKAVITGREAQQVFVIPRRAVRPDGRVLVVDDKSRIRFREISVIRTTENEVVVDSDLEAGERVVISQPETSVEGMLVETTTQTPVKETP
jgi:RND family efflux transporter MFP subunit